MALTTKQILNKTQREVASMTEKELRQAVSTLRSTARKRYERIIEAEVYSPAIKSLWRGVKGDNVLPTVSGMDIVTLRNEFKRYKAFLEKKTSTVTGSRKYMKSTKETAKEITGIDLDDESAIDFWNLYDEAKETGVGGVLNYKDVMEVTADIYDSNSGESSEELLEKIKTRLEEIYESENVSSAIYPSGFVNDDSD